MSAQSLDESASAAEIEETQPFSPDPEGEAPQADFFCEVDGARYAGQHLLIDLIGARQLDDLAHIETALRACIAASGATLLHIHLHRFTPSGGVSGVALLAESHISIHSWPEHAYAALDVFMCGNTDPHAAIDVMKEAFAPEKMVVKTELRGKELEARSLRNGTLYRRNAP